ncbi:2'-5' RNA ligase family protein [uncultured Nitrospira sp.]|uniref:2'-5' RNA ligase family protein n=1 Tax=uncultured Nitrospira sp. TaxID=157176 RepID=UPI0031407B69
MANTYHLWLAPTGQAYDILMKTITDLSKAYHAPVFDPHVTLLGSLPGTEEAISVRCLELGGLLPSFNILLTEPAYGDQYFQCVFLKTQMTPALLNAHELARSLFVKDPGPYMPHLSLLYGHYSIELKDKITSALSQVLRLNFTVNRFHLIRSKSEHPMDWTSMLTVPLSG